MDSILFDWLVIFIKFILPLILLVVAYFIGNHLEKKHYASILEREKALRHIIVVSVKRPPAEFREQRLVKGSVVVSSDYFRRLLAWLANFLGGNVRTYETLLDRARREAILRMKEEAHRQGANVIFNLKLETSSLDDINSPQNSGAVGTVEVLAYGTAGKYHHAV
ncbi:YbjQ family protein [Moraxella sp. ZY210820]|uniref:YbjQ family protein n=1 Tax=unclassified Moraxella TaxID=2685852 RepID=UPI002731590D|nr:heavy metal-binding domain-containing protein [Moraxella sp. ZY210820]WLF83226.1 YbjQ family protein [Moraxella sp. ZY210820]